MAFFSRLFGKRTDNKAAQLQLVPTPPLGTILQALEQAKGLLSPSLKSFRPRTMRFA